MATEKELLLAVLDDYGDLATESFAKIPGTKITQIPLTLDTNEELDAQVKRLEPFSVISTMRERTAFPAELLSRLPNLKLLLTSGTRNASIDSAAAEKHGVGVYGTMGADSPFTPKTQPPGPGSTVQHTVALILSLASNIPQDDYVIKRGGWQTGYLTPLGGQTLGLLGLGKLGSNTGKILLQAFGMKVIAWSANLTQAKADEAAAAHGLPPGSFRVVTKDELFAQADVLSVHYVLSERSTNLVGAAELARMKPTALFVNTSRGGLIDEKALHETLLQGRIKGCAMDVYWKEPLATDSPWRTTHWGTAESGQVILSPHMGYVTEKALKLWYDEQAENLKRWIAGEPLYSKVDNSSYA